MKWCSKSFLKDREGEERIVRKFLWLPTSLHGEYVRWLEFANIKQQVVRSVDECGYGWYWCDVGFVEQS